MRPLSVALVIALSVVLLGCCGCTCQAGLAAPANPCDTAPGAAPTDCAPAYAPPCNASGAISGVPAPAMNAPVDLAIKSALGCDVPPASELCPDGICTPPPLAAPVPSAEPPCGPLPADAKTGEVWCCVEVKPRSVGFERIVLEPSRVEWRRITCPLQDGVAEQECFVLVEIPEKVEMRPLAAPPPYFEWRRNAACEIPPAGVSPTPPPQAASPQAARR